MLFSPTDESRRVVPRWRSFAQTVATSDLRSIDRSHNYPRRISYEDPLPEKRDSWASQRSLHTASELVETALVLGITDDQIKQAAQFIVENNPVEPLHKLASVFLADESSVSSLPFPKGASDLLPDIIGDIRQLKHILRLDFNNPVALTDLALRYSILGQHRQATKSINAGLHLAPDNRFVLRAAARCFVHMNQPDRAHYILYSSPATRIDPWLLSAEIATASIRGGTSRLIKTANRLVTNLNLTHLSRSELAASLGTLQLRDGSLKKARQLFRTSLQDPNDNSLAQAQWAYKRLGGIHIEESLFHLPYSFEALALHKHRLGDWPDVVENCSRWLEDEPFSSRPADMGSFIAITMLQDLGKAETLCRAGLRANPDDSTLLNNLAVSLALQGNVLTAQQEFSKIDLNELTRHDLAVVRATAGLLLFRAGFPDLGRNYYRDAIELATGPQKTRTQALALLHLAREELVANTGHFESTSQEAFDKCSRSDHPELPSAKASFESEYTKLLEASRD